MKSNRKMKRLRYLKPLLGVLVIALFSVIIMLLWNGLMPVIFRLTTISFWQAIGLFILCRLLFGRFGPGHFGGHPGSFGKRNPMTKNWMQMSSEERKEFIRKRKEWRKQHHSFFGEQSPFEETQKENTASEKPEEDD